MKDKKFTKIDDSALENVSGGISPEIDAIMNNNNLTTQQKFALIQKITGEQARAEAEQIKKDIEEGKYQGSDGSQEMVFVQDFMDQYNKFPK